MVGLKSSALEKPLRSLSGATITTRPRGRNACAKAWIPGAKRHHHWQLKYSLINFRY